MGKYVTKEGHFTSNLSLKVHLYICTLLGKFWSNQTKSLLRIFLTSNPHILKDDLFPDLFKKALNKLLTFHFFRTQTTWHVFNMDLFLARYFCCTSSLHHREAHFSMLKLNSPFRLNHFIHHTQNAKWDAETSAAASSLSGYHGDKRHIFTLTPHSNKGFVPPHENTRRVSCSKETCRIFSPDWRKDIASDGHGSVGAVHKGKNKIFVYI